MTAARGHPASQASTHQRHASAAFSDADSVISAPVKSSKQHRLQSLRLVAFEQPDFDVANLLSALTEETIGPNQGASDSKAAPTFDPQPYIHAFEAAVNQLLPLRQRVFGKAGEYEATVLVAEREYNAKLKELRENFEAVSMSFSSLEGRISEVSRTAIRIGDQLESIDKGKQRAVDAHDIIQYYFDFARGDSSNLERLKKEGGREGRAKVALIARRLAAVAKEVESMPDGDQTRQAIERYCERFENDMLNLFDRYYRKGDPKGMAHCAKVLLDFNGGQSCIRGYINQHDFFISKDRISDGSSLIDAQIWETLPDPNTPAPKEEPKLTIMYGELRETVAQEAQITQAVFPNPALVMQVFLQRVFAQVIEMYIERMILDASSSSALAYLRILHLAHQSTFALVKDLKGIDLFKAAALRIDSTEARVPASGNADRPDTPSNNATANLSMIGTMLDQVFEELFDNYMKDNSYIEKEVKSLNELYASYLLRFMTWHQTQSAGKPNKTVFDRMVNQLTQATQSSGQTNANTSPIIGSDTGSMTMGGLKALLKLGNISTATNTSPAISADRRTSDSVPSSLSTDGELDINAAERMLKWHAEAVGRMVDLSNVADVPKNAFTLLRTLSDSYGRAYVETALHTTLSQMTTSGDVKTPIEPDLNTLQVVYKADIIMNLWQRYIGIALMPLAGPSLTTRREMGIFTNHVIVRIEGKIDELVQRLTDATLSWLSVLLNRQRKTDFKPKNDDLALSTMNTEACIACRDFCHRVKLAATSHLSGRNKETFLSEIGLGFHSLLLEHLKRFPVSSTGGLMLTRDLAIYEEAVLAFEVPALSERFDMLRQLGNVFVVRPEIIKSYMSESYLAKIEGRLLRPFLLQRVDYGDYSRKFWDDVCGDNSNTTNGNGSFDRSLQNARFV